MRVLLLAGTFEARNLISPLVTLGYEVIASLAGVTRDPKRLSCETRVGGFGGDEGFRDWLKSKKIDVVIDATHPFAIKITERTLNICSETMIPCLSVVREPWVPGPGDEWLEVDSSTEAANRIKSGSTVFLATGRQTLVDFGSLEGCYVFCRQIDEPNEIFPFKHGKFIVGRPPFSVENEINLFKQLKVDILVVKNSGGSSSFPKLAAASFLKMPVLMIKRPEIGRGNRVNSIAEALDWIDKIEKN
ncbi:MAG: precorrin-6A/cobalt-precorrin-6A reductase [Paracoccaceae bacterium]